MTPGQRLTVAAAYVAVAACTAGSAAAAPTRAPTYAATVLAGANGAEPSLAVDPSDPRRVYVLGLAGEGGSGSDARPHVWASADSGRSFGQPVAVAPLSNDAEIIVVRDGSIVVANVIAGVGHQICRSTDRGRSFSSQGVPCTVAPVSIAGPLPDRPWFTRGHGDTLYLTYNDFALTSGVVLRSQDAGRTFLPCAETHDFSARRDTVLGFTTVTRPVLTRSGRMVATFRQRSTTAEGAQEYANDDYRATGFYAARSPAGSPCGTTAPAVYTSHTIHEDPGARLGGPFDDLTIDAGGTLYAVTTGRLAAGRPDRQLYLLRSRDEGRTWIAAGRVTSPDVRSSAMPVLVAGAEPGHVAVGWYGTSAPAGAVTEATQWRFHIAESRNGGATFGRAWSSQVLHEGCIETADKSTCGDRQLLDFASGALTASGFVFAVPADSRLLGVRTSRSTTAILLRRQ